MTTTTGMLLLLGTLAAGAASYRDEVLSDQPTGYWRLGDAAGATTAENTGSLGASGNGTVANNVVFGAAGALVGDANTAATFDGAQSRIDVPFAAENNTTGFTIEAWARVGTDSSGYRSPVASRDDSPQKGFIFYCDPGNNWQFWTGTGEQVGWNIVGGAAAEPEAWAHLVGTYDGANKLFYVNGVLVGANQSRFAPNGARVLRIGASATESPVGDFFFVGDLDEVAVYGKALSADRVLAHYKSGAGANPAGDVVPAVVVQPVSTNRFKGESQTLQVLATGSLPLTYRWKKNDVDVQGGNGPVLVLSNLQPSDGGTYTVTISNGAGEVTSEAAVLSVADIAKPAIAREPASRTVLPGSTASFAVVATGSSTFAYQWSFNGNQLPNATNATLVISNVQTAHLGTYRVNVVNPAGATDSAAATLQFPAAATKSYAETVKQDGPTGYWRLGEGSGEVATDEAGTNPGAYLNGVALGRPGALAGDANKAAGFATAEQTKVDVAWNEALNAATFTVECWAKVTGGSGVHRSPVTSRADAPQRGYIFYAEPGDTWQFWTGTGAATGWTVLQGPAVQLDTYAHLVGQYDGTTLSFYVNGVRVAQRDAAFGPNDVNPLRFGGGATEGDGNFFFQGDIDEVAVFNKALSEDRILAHYVAGFPLTTPPGIATQPRSQAAPPGATITLTVSATGGLPLRYQWRFNGQALEGATAASLVLSNVGSAQAGDYSVVVSNDGGSVTSAVATLTIPTAPTQPYVELVKAARPVAYWRLGETSGEVAKDEMGANDGAYLEGVTLGAAGALPGDPNPAANFKAATRQKVDVPWSETINPSRFTVEVWARVTGGSGHRSPLTSRADGPQRGYIFYAEPGNTWQFWTGKGDTSGWDTIRGPAVALNKWTHLAATYDGTTKRFYVNGVAVGTSTAAFAPNDASPLRIGGGASEGPGNFFFEGDIDEAAVYGEALSHEEIIRHFLAGAPPAQRPTLAGVRKGARLELTWTGGTLESTSTLGTGWSPVANAASPLLVDPAEPARFYRVRQ